MDLPLLHSTLPELIQGVGYVGVFLMVFIESGIPFGALLPLPGDTLLFAAGILAVANAFNLIPLLTVIVIAAIAGGSAGYWFGHHYGPKLFTKEDALFLNKRHLDRVEQFYAKYGKRSLIFARFIPILRTIVPIAAGMGRMPYRDFLVYNIAGALIWGLLITLAGYYLGALIPNIDQYLLPLLGLAILLTVIGAWREIAHARSELNGNSQ